MKDKMIKELSDISRTNQLKITETSEEVAEKLYQYLFKIGKGIESFSADKLDLSEYEGSPLNFFQKRHRAIKKEIKKILSIYDKNYDCKDIQYFLSYSKHGNMVFFLSPNKTHSGWKQLFVNNQERILNLVFKFFILSQSIETIKGSEELLLLHSIRPSKSKDTLIVWGQSLFIKYNYHNVLTLTLTRKNLCFSPRDQYNTFDGDDLGDLLVYEKKNYYFDRPYDGRSRNYINFMQFDKEDKNFEKFKKTQLYYYQNFTSKLENFLNECGISFDTLDFQADHFLKNPFISNIESIESLEVINNVGVDLTELDQKFLKNFLLHQSEVCSLTFYNSGKTISTYERVEVDVEDSPYWKIKEVVDWSSIELDRTKNYLVLNKLLEEETGSRAYQGSDGLWYPSTKLDSQKKIDFYSQLKKRFNYLNTGEFFSMQGLDIIEFRAIGDENSLLSVLNYTTRKIDRDTLQVDTQIFTDGKLLDIESSILCYLREQTDCKEWKKFCDTYKLKVSPQFQKILIELSIKNWIKHSIVNSNFGLAIPPQTFSEKKFFAIYVRSPLKKEAQAVAVEFLYKEGFIYITNVMRDMKQIEDKFQFLRKRKNKSQTLIDAQQYFVDESDNIYINCYTDDLFTPILIGRKGILEEMENGSLKINRKIKDDRSSRLLPLVTYYNIRIQPIKRIQNMICLDLNNESFIQYFVPPAQGLDEKIKRGFRVYHLIGKTYSKESVLTSELIQHPITSLHFTTLTQNILKISDNSQSSLLQKVARVLIEN
jgi:hypothetical protein